MSAGNKDDDLGQFPTKGDWYGRFEWKHDCKAAGIRMSLTATPISRSSDVGNGNLTGTLTGRTPRRNQQIMPACTMTYLAPGTFSAKLKGSYSPRQETFNVEAFEGQATPGRASYSCT